VGPLLYVLLVTVLGLLWEGYDPIRDSMSELGGVESPYGRLMNVAGFMALGVSILAFAAAYRLLLPRGRWQAIALPLAAMASAFVFGSDRRFGLGWQAFSGWTGLVSLATGPLVAAGSLAAVTGLVQRAGIGLSLLWMTAVSFKLHALAPGRTGARRRGDQPWWPAAAARTLTAHPREWWR
jgi:hypothetical protein